MKNSHILMILSPRLILVILCWGLWPRWSFAAEQEYFQVIVNSNRDEIQADDFLTLREAIAIINRQLPLEKLSAAEKQQVLMGPKEHRLEFRLAADQGRIILQSELPAITAEQLSIDARSNKDLGQTGIQDISFFNPSVEITPAPGIQIGRGLTLLANNIRVSGLSLFGFQAGSNGSIQNVPAADITVGNAELPAPQGILIENNFLGVQADRSMPAQTSDFGVFIFNSQGTTVRHNAIGYHSASGLISQVNANNLLIENNAIFGNGTNGMPDAIRLEGKLINNTIRNNLICGNDGSGIFIFKPDAGSVNITNNRLQSNGRRLRRAAIHLMGNDHQVTNNTIEFQAGAGVAVTGFSDNSPGNLPAMRNQITNNRFQQLEGLSVDLITYRNSAVEDFQDGDGINPQRNSENRRLDTGNGAINAPQFLAREFYRIGDQVNLDGLADPGSQVEIYQVNVDQATHGPLSRLLSTVTADAQGKFQATLSNLSPGTTLTAIATDSRYGTSEPAANVLISVPGQTIPAQLFAAQPPECALVAVPVIKQPVAEKPPVVPPVIVEPPPITPEQLPTTIKIEIARNIHFALDKSAISPASAQVLKQVAQVLQANPFILVDLAGHTDPRAPQAYNQALGLRRATAVRNYLLQQGVAPQRMTIRSYGFSKRRSNEQGAYSFALDRRVEMEYRDLRGIQLEVIDRLDDLQIEK